MSYIHLTISERSKIETYVELGYSLREIAARLKRSPSTISRELRRHANCTIEQAQVRYQTNKSNGGAKLKLTPDLKEAVQEKLGETWSPEQIVGRLYQGAIQTATTDRGKEFSCYNVLEKDLNIQVYFTDPYSWQRGSNENGNGLLREFFPKKTNFDHVTSDEMKQALHFINNRPRKCLGWKTAHEAFKEEQNEFFRNVYSALSQHLTTVNIYVITVITVISEVI